MGEREDDQCTVKGILGHLDSIVFQYIKEKNEEKKESTEDPLAPLPKYFFAEWEQSDEMNLHVGIGIEAGPSKRLCKFSFKDDYIAISTFKPMSGGALRDEQELKIQPSWDQANNECRLLIEYPNNFSEDNSISLHSLQEFIQRFLDPLLFPGQ